MYSHAIYGLGYFSSSESEAIGTSAEYNVWEHSVLVILKRGGGCY